jgi:hypothetical protein
LLGSTLVLRAQGEEDPAPLSASERLAAAIASSLELARGIDNEEHRNRVDSMALALQRTEHVRAAEAYGAQGAVLFLKHFFDETVYAYARAATLEPLNPEWANNLGATLLERGDADAAIDVLTPLTELYPNLDMAIGNLAAALVDQGDCRDAALLATRAMALSPETGLYRYILGKAFACDGSEQKAKDLFDSAWALGFAGSGREGEPPGEGGAGGKGPGKGTGTAGVPGGKGSGSGSNAGSSGTHNQANATARPGGSKSIPPPPANDGKAIPQAWVGHYEAEYVRGRTERRRMYGQGMAQTAVNEDILVCAKDFSMNIDPSGNIQGNGRLMYVFLGTAAGMATAMTPGILAPLVGGYMATLKDGYQERDWTFTGRVDAKGNVEISGIPSEKLPFINLGQKEQIMQWSAFPPPDRSPRSPSRMTLATEKEGVPSIHIDRPVDFGQGLVLQYQAYIRKTDEDLTPDCRRVEPPKEKCPASEYLKLKSSVGANGKMTVESSYDVGSGKSSMTGKVGAKVGPVSGSVDATGKCQIRGQVGMVTGGAEYNVATGNYQMSVGIGVDSGKLLPGPNKVSERVELVYDSRCGWGIKGTASISTMSMGAEVEGAVFFNKGM